MTALWRRALMAAMYNAARTAARPPHVPRRPRCCPLSRFSGAIPTSAASCLCVKEPKYVRANVPQYRRRSPRTTMRHDDPPPGSEVQVDFFYVGAGSIPRPSARGGSTPSS